MAPYLEFNGFACLPPNKVAEEMSRIADAGVHISTQDWEGLANSFCNQRGSDPSFAYLLVPAAAINAVSSSAGSGLRIVFRDGSEATWTKLKVELGRKISPAATEAQGYYFVKAVDQRYALALDYVSQRFNLVIDYEVPPPGSPSTQKGEFKYHIDTVKANGPYSWQELFKIVFVLPGATSLDFSGVFPQDYPPYIPQDLDWRYMTRRDALETLLQWCNFSVEPKPNGQFKLIKVRNPELPGIGPALQDALSKVSQFLVADKWTRFKQPGEPACNFDLHFNILGDEGSLANEYATLTRVPQVFNVSPAHLDLRMASCVVLGVPLETYPEAQKMANVADAWIAANNPYFQQFPPIERTYSGYLPIVAAELPAVSPGEFIERVTYYDLGDGPFTHVTSIAKRNWLPKPIHLDQPPDVSTQQISVAAGEVWGVAAAPFPIVFHRLRRIAGDLGAAEGVTIPYPLPLGQSIANYNGAYIVSNNTHSRNYALGDSAILVKQTDSPLWDVENVGDFLVRFELAVDKHVLDDYALAALVDPSTGAASGDLIYVRDPELRYMGYAARVDPLYGDQKGFQGLAVKRGTFLPPDAAEELPAYEIVRMEQVCRYLEAYIHPDYPFKPSETNIEGVAIPTELVLGLNYWDGRSPKTTEEEEPSPGQEPLRFVQFQDRTKIFPKIESANAVGSEDPTPNTWRQVKLVWDEKIEKFQLFAAQPLSTERQMGLLVKPLAKAEANLVFSGSQITNASLSVSTVVENAALLWNTITSRIGVIPAEQHSNKTLKFFDAVNHASYDPIKAGDGLAIGGSFYNDPPIWFEGYKSTYRDEGELKEIVVVTRVIGTVTIYAGFTTTQVQGTPWDMVGLTRLCGNPLPAAQTGINNVANPDGWNGPNGGYAVAIRLPDGTWRGIDLECEPESQP